VARCGHCAKAAHKDGEKTCPAFEESAKRNCPNCGDNHTAWDRRCPVLREQRARADAAYLQRPRQFAVAGSTGSSSPPPRTTSSSEASGFAEETQRGRSADGGWTTIHRKRQRTDSAPPPKGETARQQKQTKDKPDSAITPAIDQL
jgi:hypothetical protein